MMDGKVDITEYIHYREYISKERDKLTRVWAWLGKISIDCESQDQRIFLNELSHDVTVEALKIDCALEETKETYCKQLGEDFVVWFNDAKDYKAVFKTESASQDDYYIKQVDHLYTYKLNENVTLTFDSDLPKEEIERWRKQGAKFPDERVPTLVNKVNKSIQNIETATREIFIGIWKAYFENVFIKSGDYIEITGVDLGEFFTQVYELSEPAGRGYIHYKPGGLDPETLKSLLTPKQDASLFKEVKVYDLDYVHGRCCKMTVWEVYDRRFIKKKWFRHSEDDLKMLLSLVGMHDVDIK